MAWPHGLSRVAETATQTQNSGTARGARWARSRLKDIPAILMVLFALALLGVYLVFVQLPYSSGVGMMPANREPAARQFPEHVRMRFATYSHYGWPPMYPRLGPASALEALFLENRPFPGPQEKLASDATRQLLRRPGDGINHSRYQLNTEAAATVWISRNWSAEQALDTVLADGDYGQNKVGLDAASEYYFGLPLDALHDEELQLLFLLHSFPDYDPWCASAMLTALAKQDGVIAPDFRRVQPRITRCPFGQKRPS